MGCMYDEVKALKLRVSKIHMVGHLAGHVAGQARVTSGSLPVYFALKTHPQLLMLPQVKTYQFTLICTYGT